ncbi:hypothetical protein DUNSADRAFT_12674, partial [Dunaliella salina]
VKACLQKDADSQLQMKRFQDNVEKGDPTTISVQEVVDAFPIGFSLSEAVNRALNLHEDGGLGSSKLPKLEEHYVSREQDALDLEHKFHQQLDSKSSSHGAAVCVVAGAGMGKSSLGLDVGWRFVKARMCPAGAVFVDLREACTFEAVIWRMCCALDVSVDEHAVNNIKSNLKSRSNTWSGPFFVLLDNAEDAMQRKSEKLQLEHFFTEVASLAMLLITSRDKVAEEKGMQQHELHSMDVNVCRELMRSVAANLEEQEVCAAVDLCHGVPLLVRRAADALQNGQIVLQDLKDAMSASNDHTSAVLTLTLRTMPRKQQLLMARLTFFPSNFTVAGAAAVLDQSEAQTHGQLCIFYRHGLVKRGTGGNTFALHMAVREASSALGGEAITQGRVHFVAFVFKQLDLWARMFLTSAWEPYLALAREAGPDIMAAFEMAGSLVAQQSQAQVSMLQSILAVDAVLVQELLSCAGYPCKGTWSKLECLHESIQVGSDSEKAAALLLECVAESDYEKAATAHDLCCQALGPEHPRSIACVHAMAQGQKTVHHRYQEAEALFREAYEMRLRVMGEQAPVTWMSLQGLASCIAYNQALHAKAEPEWSKLLDVLRKELGDQHPMTLDAGEGLAKCLGFLGKLEEAEDLIRKNLDARQKVLGLDHPDSITSVSTLADCLSRQGKYNEAEILYRECLAARQDVLGPNHLSSIASKNTLANCLSRRGKWGDAEYLYRQSLEARQRSLHPDNPSIFDTENNLADSLSRQGKMAEAEALYQQSLAGRQHVLGPNHLKSIASENNLANSLFSQGKYNEAEAYYKTSLAARRRVLTPYNLDSITSANSLANCLYKQDKYEEAENVNRESLAAQQHDLGPDHPGTSTSIASVRNIAICLSKQGKMRDAEAHFRKTLEARQSVLGQGHHDSIVSMGDLSSCLFNQEKLPEAEAFDREVLEVLGTDHPAWDTFFNNTNKCLSRQGKWSEAQAFNQGMLEVLGMDHPASNVCIRNIHNCLSRQGEGGGRRRGPGRRGAGGRGPGGRGPGGRGPGGRGPGGQEPGERGPGGRGSGGRGPGGRGPGGRGQGLGRE